MDSLNKNNLQPRQERVSMVKSGFITRIAVFSILWLFLAEWQLSSLIVGGVFIIAASLLSLYLAPQNRQVIQSCTSLKKSLSFLFYFSVQSVRGGWDIAKLALIPSSKISPGFIKYQTDLIDDSQVFAFMQVLSLLPGTVSAGQDGREVSIHVLDLSSFSRSDIDDCQQWITHLADAQKELPLDARNS